MKAELSPVSCKLLICPLLRIISALHKSGLHRTNRIEQRIQRAKVLLSATEASVTDIGAILGFSSSSHFATTFKQRVGVTPTVYRTHS